MNRWCLRWICCQCVRTALQRIRVKFFHACARQRRVRALPGLQWRSLEAISGVVASRADSGSCAAGHEPQQHRPEHHSPCCTSGKGVLVRESERCEACQPAQLIGGTRRAAQPPLPLLPLVLHKDLATRHPEIAASVRSSCIPMLAPVSTITAHPENIS